MYNFICVDVETGGFDPTKNPVTEIALIVYDAMTLTELERFETFVQNYEGLVYDDGARKATGITDEQCASGMLRDDVVKILIELFKKYTTKRGKQVFKPMLVGHNIEDFDYGFIDTMFDYSGKNLAEYIDSHFEDTLKMARTKWMVTDMQKFNLGACCVKAGIEHVDAHRAMSDTEVTFQLHKVFIQCLRNSGVSQIAEVKKYRETFQF